MEKIATSDKPCSKTFYGFGRVIDEHNGHKTIGHSGGNEGFRTYYSCCPDDELSVIILTNQDEAKPAEIVKALAEYYFRKKE